MLNTSYKKPIFAVSKDSSRKITKFLVCSALFLTFSSQEICKQLQSVFLEMDTEGQVEEGQGGRKEKRMVSLALRAANLLFPSAGNWTATPLCGSRHTMTGKALVGGPGYLSVSGCEASQLNRKSAAWTSLIAPPSSTVEARARVSAEQGKRPQPGWGRRASGDTLAPTPRPAHLPTPELPQVLTDAAAEPTTLPLEHGAACLRGSRAGPRAETADWSKTKLDDWFPKGKGGKGRRKRAKRRQLL